MYDPYDLTSGKKPPEPVSDEEALFGERFYKWFENHGATYIDTDMGVASYEVDLNTLMDAIFGLVHSESKKQILTWDGWTVTFPNSATTKFAVGDRITLKQEQSK